MKTLTQSQSTQPQQSQPDKIDGQFDSSIGLPPQSQNPEYLAGYYGSGKIPF